MCYMSFKLTFKKTCIVVKSLRAFFLGKASNFMVAPPINIDDGPTLN